MVMTHTYIDRGVSCHTLCCDIQHFKFFNSSILSIFIRTVTVMWKPHYILC